MTRALHPAPRALKRATPNRDLPTLMPLAMPTSTWQAALGRALREALEQAVRQPSPQGTPPSNATRVPQLVTTWRTATPPVNDLDHWAARLAPQRQHAGLYARCLHHYDVLLHADEPVAHELDAGVATAGFLAACVQAQEWHAVTPTRWIDVALWLDRNVTLPASERLQEELRVLHVRLSLLTVAIGEWSQQASIQGALAQSSAALMARQHLRHEFGLDMPALLLGLYAAQLIPAHSARPGGATDHAAAAHATNGNAPN